MLLRPPFPGSARDRVSWSARSLLTERFERTAALMDWGFSLHALAEVVYMTYHLDWAVFLFAYTTSEVLDLVTFVLIFAGATRTLIVRPSARPAATVVLVR